MTATSSQQTYPPSHTQQSALAPSDDPAETWARLQESARAHCDASRFEEARALCREMLDCRPHDRTALDILAKCRFDLNAYKAESPWPPGCAPTPSPAGAFASLLEQFLTQVGFRDIQRLGYHLQRNHYYSPLNDCEFLENHPELWRDNPEPPAIDWRLPEQIATAQTLGGYAEELRTVPDLPPIDQSQFAWRNSFWNNADAVAQYALVRSRAPRRYIEVGCGWSSMLLRQALDRNRGEGKTTAVTLIEPHPNSALFCQLPSGWQLQPTILQRVPLSCFAALEAGDFLFYDGSHCAKVASDVNWFFFRILPLLKPGVIIHLHDIHLPADYSDDVIFGRGQTWNEQYVLQAFLMHNTAYRILLAHRYLFLRCPAALEALCRGVQPAVGCSFWMEKVSDGSQDSLRQHPQNAPCVEP